MFWSIGGRCCAAAFLPAGGKRDPEMLACILTSCINLRKRMSVPRLVEIFFVGPNTEHHAVDIFGDMYRTEPHKECRGIRSGLINPTSKGGEPHSIKIRTHVHRISTITRHPPLTAAAAPRDQKPGPATSDPHDTILQETPPARRQTYADKEPTEQQRAHLQSQSQGGDTSSPTLSHAQAASAAALAS